MPTAILIGFEYSHNRLSGTIIDLYYAYKWCKSWDCDVYVLTDMEHVMHPEILQMAINMGIVDEDIISFYDSISSRRVIVHNISDILQSISKILCSGSVLDNKLVIYYTGHGVTDCIVVPDTSHLLLTDFRDCVVNGLNPSVEIFWILDCCNPNGLYLPYKLENNTFILSSSKIEFMSNPILLITSARDNEKSISTKLGSVFSQHLFRILTLLNKSHEFNIDSEHILIPTFKNRNLRRLIGNLSSSIRKMKTGYDQTVSIYSSYIIDPILWLWIGSSSLSHNT